MTKQNPTLEYSRRMARILYAIEYLGRYCEICKLDGFTAPWLMDFHHKDQSTKKYEVKNKLYSGSFMNHKEELDKCGLICVSCHRNNHATIEKYQKHQDLILTKLDELRKNGTGNITKNHFLTNEDKDKILQMIESGLNMPEISEQLKLNYGTVKSFVRRNELDPNRSRIKISWSIVAKMLNAKHSIRNIAKKLNINRETIRSQIHKHIVCEQLDNGVRIYETIDDTNQISVPIAFAKPNLQPEDIINIRRMFTSKEATKKELKKLFNVSSNTISRVINYESWKNIK